MENVNDFIAKLERVNFTSVNDRDTLVSDDGFELSYHTKLQVLIGSGDDCGFVGLPVQLIFRVEKDGRYVTSWGCMELEDTTGLAKWYVLKVNELAGITRDIERRKEQRANLLWDNI